MCTRKLLMKAWYSVLYYMGVNRGVCLNLSSTDSNSFVIAMCRVTMWYVRENKITQLRLER